MHFNLTRRIIQNVLNFRFVAKPMKQVTFLFWRSISWGPV